MGLDIVESQKSEGAQKWPKFIMGQNQTSLNMPTRSSRNLSICLLTRWATLFLTGFVRNQNNIRPHVNPKENRRREEGTVLFVSFLLATQLGYHSPRLQAFFLRTLPSEPSFSLVLAHLLT